MRCILFDLDGVLIDTRPVMMAAFQYVATGLGLPVPTPIECLAAAALPPRKGVVGLFPNQPRALSLFRAGIRIYADQLRPCAGIGELLQAIASERLGVVTSRNQEEADFYLASSSLARYFSAIISWGHTARHKPHPDPLLEAARRLGVSHGIYIGDMPGDMTAAVAGGFEAIGALWASSFGASDLRASGAHYIAESPQAVLTYLHHQGGAYAG